VLVRPPVRMVRTEEWPGCCYVRSGSIDAPLEHTALAWTGIVGTSAPLRGLRAFLRSEVVLRAGVVAILLIAANTRINPPS
jgi:hypothetical protein